MALAAAGMVVGEYPRWGWAVSVGRPNRFCTTMTLREGFGDADSILLMKSSYPTPFCTISSAAPPSLEPAGLASKVCGSVLGLLRMDETWTYRPPIWESTLAYSFSAPMALITAGELAAAASGPGSSATTPRPPRRQTSATSQQPEGEQSRTGCRQRGRLCPDQNHRLRLSLNTSHDHAGYLDINT